MLSVIFGVSHWLQSLVFAMALAVCFVCGKGGGDFGLGWFIAMSL